MMNMKNRRHIGIGMTAALLALAVASLYGCRKQENPGDDAKALSFSVHVLPETRTHIAGNTLVDATAGRLPIFATGTYYWPNDTYQSLFIGQKFAYDGADGAYHATPDPAYWLFGGRANFLAYAGPASSVPSSNPTVTWPGSQGADAVSFVFTDTKAADMDLVWAAANDKANMLSPVDLTFSHAMARLELEVRSADLAPGRLTLKSVVLQTGDSDRLKLAGTFSVDNTRNVPDASWSGLSTTADYGFFTGQQVTFTATGETSLVGLLDGTARQALSGPDFVPFVQMFIPAQPSKNMVVTYSLDGGADIIKTVNLSLSEWEMGHTYRYRLEFAGDITLGVTINAWEAGNTLNMELQ